MLFAIIIIAVHMVIGSFVITKMFRDDFDTDSEYSDVTTFIFGFFSLFWPIILCVAIFGKFIRFLMKLSMGGRR